MAADGLLRSLRTGPAARRLAVAALVDATGTGMSLAITTLFLTRQVGLGVAAIGTGFAIAAVVGVCASVPIGVLADRVGPARVYVLLQVWLAAAYLLYPTTQGFAGFVVAACMVATGLGATVPVLQAMVAGLVDDGTRVTLMALTRSVNNVGYGLGGALATIVLVLDTRAAYTALFVANAVSFLIAAALIRSLPRTRVAPAAAEVSARPPHRLGVAGGAAFVGLAGVNGVLCLYSSLLTIGVPLWVAGRTAAPVAIVGPLLVVNTVLCVLLQVRLSSSSAELPGARRAYVRAGAGLGLACLLLALSGVPASAFGASALLVLAVVALSLGEIYQAAAQFGAGYALSPVDQRGRYLAVLGLGLNAQRAYGPPAVALAAAAGGPVLLPLGAVLAAAGTAAARLARPPRSASETVEPPADPLAA